MTDRSRERNGSRYNNDPRYRHDRDMYDERLQQEDDHEPERNANPQRSRMSNQGYREQGHTQPRRTYDYGEESMGHMGATERESLGQGYNNSGDSQGTRYEQQGLGAQNHGRMGAGYMTGGYGQQSKGVEGSGPHVGRGPKGYQRSDQRIEEDVCEQLTQHGHIDASEIEVRVSGGEVTLTGTVDSRQTKRLAEDIVDVVSGVREIHNQLRVSKPGQHSQGMQQNPGMQGGGGVQSTRASAGVQSNDREI